MKPFKTLLLGNKLAITSLAILVILYSGLLFAEFLAPYTSQTQFSEHVYHPPNLSFYSKELGFRLQVQETVLIRPLDMRYARVPEKYHPVRIFTSGAPIRLFGLLPANIHLFGTTTSYNEEESLSYPVFLLGSDGLGRDVFSRILYGSRISLSIGFVGISISTFLALLLGGLSGYFGGAVDWVIMRLAELIILIPGLYLILFLRSVLSSELNSGQTYLVITAILSFVGWPGSARLVRGMVHSIKREDFVVNAELESIPTIRILFVYIMPHLSSILIVSAALSIPGFILGEVLLSYLGLGITEPAVSWGSLLSREATTLSTLQNFPWLLTPGIMLLLATLGFTFFGEFLRDYFDPHHA